MAEMSAKSKATAQKADLSKFRNSKLTLLLSNALRGNSHTSVIVTLSPSLVHFDTSLSSIKFAMEVKGIKIQATSSAGKDPQAVIKKLEQEIEELKQKLAAAPTSADETNTPGGVDPALESENRRLQKEVAELKAKPAVDPALESENKRLQKEVAELNAKPAVDPALESENKRLQKEVAELKAKPSADPAQERENKRLQKEVADLKARPAVDPALKTENRHLQDEVAQLKKKLALASQAPSSSQIGNDHSPEKVKNNGSSAVGKLISQQMFPEINGQLKRVLDVSKKNREQINELMAFQNERLTRLSQFQNQR